MRIVLILLILFSFHHIQGQSLALSKGVVTDNLKISDSTDERFSVYVPRDFVAGSSYKILFVLDPEGNGLRAARLFSSLMITDDFVIASNGWALGKDLEKNAENTLAMIQRIAASIPFDQKHIYIAGLDEGAATASALNYVLKGFTGILLINDAFVKNELLNHNSGTTILGMVGQASKNYYKMQNAFNYFRAQNRENALYEYNGEGGWPISNYLGSTFNSLYFSVTENGGQSLSDSLVNLSYKADYATAESLMRQKEYLVAYDFIDALKDKYRGKLKLSPLRDLIQGLRRDRGYKNARRTNLSHAEDEIFLQQDLSYFLEEDMVLANFDNLGYWDGRLRELEAAEKNNAKPYEQEVAKRMLGLIDNALEGFELSYTQGNLSANQAIFFNTFKTLLDARDYQAYKNIISLAAKDKDDDTAYFYLEQLLKNGYEDYEALYAIPDTEVLHITPTFNTIVKKYLKKAKY